MPSSSLMFFILLSAMLPNTSLDGAEVIDGSSHEIYCPHGASTVSFEHPTLGHLVNNIDKGRLRIPKITREHDGAYTCRDYAGNEKASESIQVVSNPGRYEIDMTTPRMALHDNFRLECIIQGNITGTYAYFLVDGIEEIFTNYSEINRNKWRFIYERPHDRVSRHDDGTEVQCVVKNRFGEPCCERSAKKKVIVEPPHATARPARETADNVNEGSAAPNKRLSILALVIAVGAILLIGIVVIWIKKRNQRNSLDHESVQETKTKEGADSIPMMPAEK